MAAKSPSRARRAISCNSRVSIGRRRAAASRIGAARHLQDDTARNAYSLGIVAQDGNRQTVIQRRHKLGEGAWRNQPRRFARADQPDARHRRAAWWIGEANDLSNQWPLAWGGEKARLRQSGAGASRKGRRSRLRAFADAGRQPGQAIGGMVMSRRELLVGRAV